MRRFNYDTLKDRHWDSEILGLVAQIHEFKGRQELYLKQKPAALDKLVEIAKIQSTEASNKIEGIVTTSTRMQQLCQDKTTPRTVMRKKLWGIGMCLIPFTKVMSIFRSVRPTFSNCIVICTNTPERISEGGLRIRRI